MTEIISTHETITTLTPNNPSQGNKDKICNGFGCNKKYILKIQLNTGKIGIITLYLCNTCFLKLPEDKICKVLKYDKM